MSDITIGTHVILEAKITRADGTVEDLGVIADSDDNVESDNGEGN